MDEKESNLSEAGPETRLQKSVRVARPWMLVALLAFGLGALLIAVALYFPNRQILNTANADLEHANATISSMTDQVATLQTDNETLQKDLDSATLHMYVLKALSSVRGASLAVADDDYAGARLSLIGASEALDTLSGLLGTDQKDVLSDMQKSAAQALTEIQTDLTSAPPELDLLTKNLVQLEKNLFPNP
jgi:flagellar motility protein MotE (MotC chaperone)